MADIDLETGEDELESPHHTLDKLLSVTPSNLRDKIEEADKSVDFEKESLSDTHEVKKRFKQQVGKTAAFVVWAIVAIGAVAFVFLVILAGRLVFMIWDDQAVIFNVLGNGITHLTALIVGALGALFLKKKL